MSKCDHCETLVLLGEMKVSDIRRGIVMLTNTGLLVCAKHAKEYSILNLHSRLNEVVDV